MEFDHAGVATEDFDALADLYRRAFDARLVHEEEFEGLRVGFCDLGNGYFELLEPADDETTIATFIDRYGPGMHHLALRTHNLEAALANAADHGVSLIDEEPRPGAWGHDVAFLHPESTGGVLVEFVEH